MKNTFLALAVMGILTGCTGNDVVNNVPVNTIPKITQEPETVDASNDTEKINAIIKEVEEFDVTGWNTYTNEEYGFSIMHPESFEVQEVPDGPGTRFRLIELCGNDSSDCISAYGIGISPSGRFQESLYESELTDGFDFAGRFASVVTDSKLPNKDLFGSIQGSDGSECKIPPAGTSNSSGLRISKPPTSWSVSDSLISVYCTNSDHAPSLRKMLDSFRFL